MCPMAAVPLTGEQAHTAGEDSKTTHDSTLTCWWECKLVQPPESMEGPQKTKQRTPMRASGPLLGVHLKEMKLVF